MVKTSVLLATGVNADGYRELLGMQVATAESTASWTGFFRDLVARGLTGVFLVTSDAHLVYPSSLWLTVYHRIVGSGVAHISRKTCRLRSQKRSGRHYRPCSTRSSSNPTPRVCRPRSGRITPLSGSTGKPNVVGASSRTVTPLSGSLAQC